MAAKDENGESPLLIALKKRKYEEKICDLLLDQGTDVNVTDKCGKSPLHIAIIRGTIRIIEKLLDKGADMEAKDRYGTSPLLIAVGKRNLDSCDLLLDRGADVNGTDKYGQSPLHIAISWNSGMIQDSSVNIAIRERQIRLIEKLLDKGADVEAKENQCGENPLIFAVEKEYYDACQLLLDRGADVNVKRLDGQTPLHIADCCYRDANDCKKCIIENLLLWGGSMLVTDNNGETPLDKVKQCISPFKVLRTLKKHVIKLKPKEFKIHLDLELECELKKHFESPEVLQSILTEFDDEEYFTCCLQELEKMKTKKFGCHSLYYYYLFSKQNYPTYVKDYELEQAIETNILDLEFPIYAALVKVTFSKAKRRRPLLDAAQLLVNMPLPNEIVREILSYLSNDDLKAIIESSEQL